MIFLVELLEEYEKSYERVVKNIWKRGITEYLSKNVYDYHPTVKPIESEYKCKSSIFICICVD